MSRDERMCAKVDAISEAFDLPQERELVLNFDYGRPRLEQRSGRGVTNISPRLPRGEMDLYLDGMWAAASLAFGE